MEHERDGGAVETLVAGVHGRDDVLTIDDRFDEYVEAFDGKMIGDRGCGTSKLDMYDGMGGRDRLLLNNGLGISSGSI